MTSTVQGLQDLVSEEGYKHLDRGALAESAKLGCPLCILMRTYSGISYLRTRVFAELEIIESQGMDCTVHHPLRGSRIKRLLLNTPPGQEILTCEMRAFTISGK
jgi:hypothetical protein